VEFVNEFRVPADIGTTFATLTDLERVAPCLPGATLEEVDGDTDTGRVKVKVGPVQVTYRGTARLVEADPVTRTGRIEASGRESRGTGTADAEVTATLVEDGDGTLVTVVTDLTISGKVAQFGRGVMAEVGGRIIDAFADRLREMIEADQAASPAPAAVTTSEAAPVPDAGPGAGPRRIVEDPDRADDALDLLEVAGSATLKRAIPVAAALLLAVLVLGWLRRRG
jgi:uncharacterized protein